MSKPLPLGRGGTPDGMTPVAFAHYAFGCAAAPDGQIWFAEFNRQRLRRLDPRSGSTATVRAGLPGMFGVAVAGDGSLYVGQDLGDQGNPGRILRLHPDGTGETIVVDGITRPRQIAVGPDQMVWIVCEAGSRWAGASPCVLRHDPRTGKTTVAATGLRTPQGIAVSRDNIPYVSEYGIVGSSSGRIVRIEPTGRLTPVATTLARTRGIAMGHENHIWVLNEANDNDNGNTARLMLVDPRDGMSKTVIDGLDYPQFPTVTHDGTVWFVLNRDSRLVSVRHPVTARHTPTGNRSAPVLGTVGGQWRRQASPGTSAAFRLALHWDGGKVDGDVDPDPGRSNVDGWLWMRAPQPGISLSEISTNRGDPERPQPGLYTVPTMKGYASRGTVETDVLCVRGQVGKRWPMRNPGTASESPADGFDESPVGYLAWIRWRRE